jgi:hypothetical protein
VEQLSEPQMIMQHFRNYDLDKNGNIDGLEILKAANKMNGTLARGSMLRSRFSSKKGVFLKTNVTIIYFFLQK